MLVSVPSHFHHSLASLGCVGGMPGSAGASQLNYVTWGLGLLERLVPTPQAQGRCISEGLRGDPGSKP